LHCSWKKNLCRHRLEKKNIALLNLSRQSIVFLEKCISVPHDRKTIFCFPSYFISVASHPHKIWICCHYYKRKSRRRKNKNTRKLFGKKKKLLQRYYNYISITKFTPFQRSKHGQDTSSCVYINNRETTYVQIFIVLVKKISEPFSVKIFFSHDMIEVRYNNALTSNSINWCLQSMPTFWNIIFKVCQQTLYYRCLYSN
jgi:hypothetical protein